MKTAPLISINNASATNDEPELIITPSMRIKTKTIPTSKPKKELDINDITSLDDLISLKRQDPFMYYSIPGVRSAKVLMKDDTNIDTSSLGASKIMQNYVSCPARILLSDDIDCRRCGGERSSHQNDDWERPPRKISRCDAQEEEHQSMQQQQKVTRSTRISYECGLSLLLEDILEDFDDCVDLEDDVEDPIDIILALAGQ